MDITTPTLAAELVLLATPTSTTMEEPSLDLPGLDTHVIEGEVVESIVETSPLDPDSPKSSKEHQAEPQPTSTAIRIIRGGATLTTAESSLIIEQLTGCHGDDS